MLDRITENELKAVKENVRQAEDWLAAKDIHNVVLCETEFHEILYKAAKSEVLFETISALTDKFRWLRAIVLNVLGGASQSVEQHKKILAAIERRDGRAIKKIMRVHLSDAQKKLAGVHGLLF